MRDQESALNAVEAAATGHLLMSTVHSADAVGVVTMLRSWGVADHQIATLLEVVINQGLVRTLCSKCKRSGPPTSEEKAWLRAVGLPCPKKVWHPRGCTKCLNTGYLGRTGVFEIWRRTEADYHLILEHADERTLREQLRGRGLKTVLENAFARVRDGTTAVSELQTVASHTDYFRVSGKAAPRAKQQNKPARSPKRKART
jgi:type II secretory ATPase GspE/PulE/Tfp pilus assembly ATPase PilB-like protein